MTRTRMVYTIAEELVARMKREEMESIVFESIADQLDDLPDGDLQNEYDRVFNVKE